MFKTIISICVLLGFGWAVTSNPTNQEFSLNQLLTQMGVGYFSPVHLELAKTTDKMVLDIEGYCNSLNSESSLSEVENLKLKAKQSWAEVMKSYHKVAAAPYGPIFENKKDLANNIYSWPLMNECGFHMEMMSIKETGKFSDKVLYTSKGLMGVEFGLFKDLTTTTCNTKNKNFAKVHDWLKESDLLKEKDLCAFALASAKDLSYYTKKLSEEWQTDKGNFTLKMQDPTEDPKKVLNSITDGLFTMLEIAKDTQLGKPMGLHKDCTKPEGKCPEDVEHKWSEMGFESLESQFIGLHQIFEDGGLGIYLKAQGFENIYNKIIFQNNEIIAQIQDLKSYGSLNQQIKDLDPELCEQTTEQNFLVPVCGLQRQIRTFVQLFRSEFLPALMLNAPQVYQGDAD